MNKKKKSLHLELFLLFFGVSNVIQAFTITIKNDTSYGAKATVSYHGNPQFCPPDKNKNINPGRRVVIEVGSCMVNKVMAFVNEGQGSLVQAASYATTEEEKGDFVYSIRPTLGGKYKYKVIKQMKR